MNDALPASAIPGRQVAAYASRPEIGRDRLFPEPESPTRTAFQRDRDRIIHSTAFRRLTHKTQVFVYHEGDHYRTRLTHSLEVAQIARSMARTLRLDEDLAEAIALAHDLGHPPFGHAGERALNAAMAGEGGFDHNAQSLRVVTWLERRYAAFDGLNLTWDTLEGLAKHNGPLLDAEGRPVGRFAGKPLPHAIVAYARHQDLWLARETSLEAQLAALADDIAYNAHDLDDGYRAGFLQIGDLAEAPIAGRTMAEVRRAYPDIAEARLVSEIGRRLITLLIEDVVAETRTGIEQADPRSADDVRSQDRMVRFSARMLAELTELRAFLLARVYRHPRIAGIMGEAEAVVRDLFAAYHGDALALPPEWRESKPPAPAAFARHVCDFIAGMTDGYALTEHRRLFDRTPDLR